MDSKDGGTTTTPTVSFAVADKVAEAAEQRRKLLVELSAHKSRLVELHLRREEVDREVSASCQKIDTSGFEFKTIS